MGWLKNLIDAAANSPAERHIFARLSGPGEPAAEDISPGEHYVGVRLLSSHLTAVRRWTSRYYGVVHSFCELNDELDGKAQYRQIAAPGNLRDIDGDIGDRVIQLNKPLLDEAPYLGRLDLEAGLFSVKSADLLGEFLQVAESLSDSAGAAFSASASPFLGALQSISETVLGKTDRAALEIGVDIGFPLPGQALQSGRYLVARAPMGSLDPASLSLDPQDFALLGADGAPITDIPYMILAITGAKTRSNWMNNPDLRSAWNGIRAAVKTGDMAAAKDRLAAFRFACFGSAALLPDHAEALAADAARRFGLTAFAPEGAVGDRMDMLGDLAALQPFV